MSSDSAPQASPASNRTQGNVLITGASGLIGSALSAELRTGGYHVYALDRHDASAPFHYDQKTRHLHLDPDIPLTAVVNLAGANLADGRWTKARKQTILSSRTHTTADLCAALATLPSPPRTLLSASAMGYYGDTGENQVDETSPAGNDFLAEVARQWEAATRAARDAGIRTVHMRFGLVLSADGGVLPNFILPLRLAAVGTVGSGQQYLSWISLPDALQVVMRLLEDDSLSGAFNLVSGNPVTNRDFTRTLAQVLRRPRLPPLPAPVVRLMFGEMGDAALLGSNRVVSSRLPEAGINLAHPALADALREILDSH